MLSDTTGNDRLVGNISQSIHQMELKSVKPPNVRIMTSFTVDAVARCVKPISPNEAWVSFYDKKKLSLYNKSGREEDSIKLDCSLPDQFVTTDKREILICDRENNFGSIKKINQTKDVTQLKTTAPYDPVGIFINQNKEVVVCLKTSVAIYTLDFKSCLHSIEKSKEGERLFIDAFAATENGTSYAIADKCICTVINVDLNGVVHWIYAPKTFDPAGIVNYNKEMLIISNAMFHELHFLNTSGEPLTIYSSGIQFPQSLAISPDGILWVTESCCSHQIQLISIS